MPEGHPLGEGTAQIQLSPSPIYAGDVLDEAGRVVLPRQTPYEKEVRLYLTSQGAPDEGGYVDLQIEPPEALQLLAGDDTCKELAGTFRCTAGEDGFATFLARSGSDWSGEAKISLVSRVESATITVNPAGLPTAANNFVMLIEGVDNRQVPARYNALECTLNPAPDSAFEKWPAAATRVREAEILATSPASAPGVIEHAPVIIQSLHPEAFVTLDPNCNPPRKSRLRVQLDALGRSPKFYFCFSDIGGSNMQLAYNSGALNPSPVTVDVAPEPRLLRVVTTQQQLTVGQGPQAVVAVSAFNADLQKLAIAIDVVSSDPRVLAVAAPNAVLPAQGADAAQLVVDALAAGQATLQITPELHDSPACTSKLITVVEP